MLKRVRISKRLLKLLAFAAGLLFLYLLGSLVFFNATPKEFRVTEPVITSYSVSDPQFRRDSGRLTGRDWVNGNHIEVLDRGKDIFDAMIRDIGEAGCCITKETYNFRGDEVATRFAAELASASRRGVDIHFLMDFIGSVAATRAQLDTLQQAGVDLERWREPAWYHLSRFNHRTHRKIMVLDGRVAYTGGVNTADSWLPDPVDGGYRDYHFRISGPVVREIQGAFSENWVSARGELLLGEQYYPNSDSVGTAAMQVVSSRPREGEKRMRKMLLHAIASAENSIRISSAYFFPDRFFLDAIRDASRRGVDVTILTPGEHIDQKYIRHAAHTLYTGLIEDGVAIYEFKPSMYHAKMLIIDDYFVSVGSTNFDNRSFRINDEMNVNALDSTFAREMVQHYERDLAQSERLTLEDLSNRPLRHKTWGWIVRGTIGAYL
ncbi:phospholipase D-like domain-containing protein [Natronogracilivirga saccharolytica]|uniref:PLD phosphodiesterase domain-containing protein n=1 Tax=Natronogracilivirga saccharolytica TaxID=2812953 RepID=A0A8J7UTV7_9BACT|nr:phospholipase D-like domain-containing protein [Natronogracilivirga saccharolytica]MBP3191765.1 hypothetical protein [Natronogracilivirga saccharolytica]